MFRLDHIARVATAAFGALVLSTLSVAAAVGPGHQVQPVPAAYALAADAVQAHG